MALLTDWDNDTVFIEIGVGDAEVTLALQNEGCEKYLGVAGGPQQVSRLQNQHPDLADQFTHSSNRKIVLHNNAEVLILSGAKMLSVWKYRHVRHAKWVAWRARFNVFTLLALLGCCWHMITRRYSRPRLVTLYTPARKRVRILVSQVLRQKLCYHKALHFIPYSLGIAGLFRKFEQQGVRYTVLRWFEQLPNIGPDEDVDMLVADGSLAIALEIMHALPGIQPCDVYSETGLARSDYAGTPYYPETVARRILDGAVRHNDVCLVPNRWDYFHSLAYHAVYHKGPRSDLAAATTGAGRERAEQTRQRRADREIGRSGDSPSPPLPVSDSPLSPRAAHRTGKAVHDYANVLSQMAGELGIDAEISLAGLHSYLQTNGWGPPPEMLARLAAACPRNQWLQTLATRVAPHVQDQGLAVFVVRQETMERGFEDQVVNMIGDSGFEVLATKKLSPERVEYAASRTRGGNWTCGGPFNRSGGPPAAIVVAYDHAPQPLNRRQRRRFPERTNARIFVKETIRDQIISQVPPGEGFNALHSSDHAAEAWHLIEVLAPELTGEVRNRLQRMHSQASAEPGLRRAA